MLLFLLGCNTALASDSGLLLHTKCRGWSMSVFVRVSICWSRSWNKRLSRSRCCLGLTLMGLRNCIRYGCRSPKRKGNFGDFLLHWTALGVCFCSVLKNVGTIRDAVRSCFLQMCKYHVAERRWRWTWQCCWWWRRCWWITRFELINKGSSTIHSLVWCNVKKGWEQWWIFPGWITLSFSQFDTVSIYTGKAFGQ